MGLYCGANRLCEAVHILAQFSRLGPRLRGCRAWQTRAPVVRCPSGIWLTRDSPGCEPAGSFVTYQAFGSGAVSSTQKPLSKSPRLLSHDDDMASAQESWLD